jgi:uncharacterized membrane protein
VTKNPMPALVEPVNDQMAAEPARTIGKQFADATFVKALILAAFAIVGSIAPHLVPQLNEQLATSITAVVVAVAGLLVAQQARAVPRAQAEVTRDAVYAPKTVADIVANQEPQNVDLVMIPAPAGTKQGAHLIQR